MTDTPANAAVPTAADMDALYRERAHLIALAALHYPAYLAFSDPAQPDWAVVTLDTRAGQLSWHIAPSDLDLFAHVRRSDDKQAADAYDGHSADVKHERIRRLTVSTNT